ncbi:DUF2997 domain-containing protein [bacterium]|nr:DUF2997 domain-containing protein [Betaproteobacteria bacterium]NDE15994.1 DUF2997 domain-containing protein [bacterium]
MSKTIHIVVDPKGGTKIETSGFSGSSCQDATRALEQALGAKVDEQLTGEYYTASNDEQIAESN